MLSRHMPPAIRGAVSVRFAFMPPPSLSFSFPSPCALSRIYLGQILHFCSSPKPWEEAKRKGDLEIIWWQRYLKMKMGSVPGMGGF